MMSTGGPRRDGLVALALGAAALIVAFVWGARQPDALFHAYLLAFFVWISVPLGCLAVLMIHHVGGGRWGWSVRQPAEAALSTLPLFVPLFVPVLVGLRRLYPWLRPEVVHASEELLHKRGYLNLPFFIARQLVYFAWWVGGGTLLRRWSQRSTTEPVGGSAGRVKRLSAGGLVAEGFVVSFAAIDWIGSLEPEWYSTVFGLYIFVAQALSGMAVLIISRWVWPPIDPQDPALARPFAARRALRVASPGKEVQLDLGNLLLTLVVLHAYMAFAQGYIIWIGNLPHQIGWYEPRLRGLWGGVGITLMVVHFGLPFAALLFRRVKRDDGMLGVVVGIILLARLLDSSWMVLPSAGPARAPLIGLGALFVVGLGAIWMVLYGWAMRQGRA